MSWVSNNRIQPHYDIINGKLVFVDSRGWVSVLSQWCWF